MSKRNRTTNYMESIYDVLNTPEEVYDDGITYLDEPEDEYMGFYDDDLAWADDITYLDEPEDESIIDDLGEGYIPLPKGNYVDEKVVVIDENYMLDEYELDLVDHITVVFEDNEEELKESQYEEIDNEVKEFINILSDDDLKEEITINEVKENDNIDMDKVESIIKLPKDKSLEEDLKVVPIDSEDDKIAKAIAKEHLDNVKANSNLAEFLDDDYKNPDDDTSWVDGPDLFGNDIDVIIADDPNKEFEDTDFVEGSFSQWLADNQ